MDSSGWAAVGGVSLYAYNTNRSVNAILETSLETDRSVADLLSTDVRSNVDFSLDVVFTTLPIELEQACRSAVIVTLSKGCVYSGCGNVLKLDGLWSNCVLVLPFSIHIARFLAPPVPWIDTLILTPHGPLEALSPAWWNGGDSAPVVYFCMVRDMTPPKKTIEPNDDGGDPLDTSYYASDHVVCFVTEPSKQNDELELFRPELDAFCGQLARDGVLATFDPGSSVSRHRLMSWRARAMDYLPWSVRGLKDYMAEIVHAALLGQRIEVEGGNAEQTEDLQRFCAELSPRSLLHHPADSLRPLLEQENADYVQSPPPAVLRIEDGVVTSGKGLIPTKSAFCKRWANAMVAANTDSTALKMILQNNGRKVIQEVNRIKWLLGMAETNHYALYNAQRYLSKCGTPPRALLQHVVDTIEAGTSAHAFDVVSVLIQYQREAVEDDEH